MLTTWSNGGLLDGHVQRLMKWSGGNLGNHCSIVETAPKPDLVLILVKIKRIGRHTDSNLTINSRFLMGCESKDLKSYSQNLLPASHARLFPD